MWSCSGAAFSLAGTPPAPQGSGHAGCGASGGGGDGAGPHSHLPPCPPRQPPGHLPHCPFPPRLGAGGGPLEGPLEVHRGAAPPEAEHGKLPGGLRQLLDRSGGPWLPQQLAGSWVGRETVGQWVDLWGVLCKKWDVLTIV